MKRYLFLSCLCFSFAFAAVAQKKEGELHFKSSQAQLITIYKGNIFVNGNKTYIFSKDDIVYASRRNKLVENGRSVFMFLELNGSPNKNKMIVFNIDHSIADSITTTVVSDIRDFDRDGELEFGGSEAAKPHPSADSLYYLASRFYEIKKGRITFDKELTEKTDIKVNGTYLEEPLDSNGNPKAILKSKKRS
jgi:hypothetical protein